VTVAQVVDSRERLAPPNGWVATEARDIPRL